MTESTDAGDAGQPRIHPAAAPTRSPSRRLPAAAARAAARATRPVADDARRWWLVAERPPSLAAWRRTLRPDSRQVPDQNPALRAAWLVDNHTTGLLIRCLSAVLLLAAGGLAWLSMHPVRRWVFLVCAAALAAWAITA